VFAWAGPEACAARPALVEDEEPGPGLAWVEEAVPVPVLFELDEPGPVFAEVAVPLPACVAVAKPGPVLVAVAVPPLPMLTPRPWLPCPEASRLTLIWLAPRSTHDR